ncbi:peptidoglycan-binding domain-containing protein [Vallitalea guaymasensis]|uniref:peptidoglycan-binding domain-containing protein n=1 Tax=Vallitalea guaymasensis TaxID=1185412 RepID=UPI0023527937|nr:peptidoglycan-binding domain-containing protein [Vallitalea guaymasensis]
MKKTRIFLLALIIITCLPTLVVCAENYDWDEYDNYPEEFRIIKGDYTTYPTLRYGDSGELVDELQMLLNLHWRRCNECAISMRLDDDGIFGITTAERVQEMQEGHNIDVDGIVGPITWKHLHEFDEELPWSY